MRHEHRSPMLESVQGMEMNGMDVENEWDNGEVT